MPAAIAVRLILLGILMPITLAAQEGTSAAGASRTRALAEARAFPHPDEVIVEHFVNWHRHGVPLPRAGECVSLELRPGAVAFADRGVLQIGLATAFANELAHLPAIDVALVIDCSGSMHSRGKLEKVREALCRFADRLRPEDRVTLVTFADDAHTVQPLQARGNGQSLRTAIAALSAGGSTNLHGGLMAGLRELESHAEDGRVARVLLLTDGMANVGVDDPDAILRDAKQHQGRGGRGIDVSTIGFGTDIDRHLLARLAEGGRGLAHFVGDDADITKIFDQEAQSLLAPVARDVELSVTWPHELTLEQVWGYRPTIDTNHLRIRLDDLNAGTTQVVLASFARRMSGRSTSGPTVRAELSFFDIERGARRTVDATATFLPSDDPRAEIVTDHEVRKNLTVAALATSLRQMAIKHAEHDDDNAAEVLRDALAMTDRLFPRTEDEDIRRVRDVCSRYLEVLRPDRAPPAGVVDTWGPLRRS